MNLTGNSLKNLIYLEYPVWEYNGVTAFSHSLGNNGELYPTAMVLSLILWVCMRCTELIGHTQVIQKGVNRLKSAVSYIGGLSQVNIISSNMISLA